MSTNYPLLPTGVYPVCEEALAYAIRCAERAEALGLKVVGVRGMSDYNMLSDTICYRADIIAQGSTQVQVCFDTPNPSDFVSKSTRAVTLRLRQCL